MSRIVWLFFLLIIRVHLLAQTDWKKDVRLYFYKPASDEAISPIDTIAFTETTSFIGMHANIDSIVLGNHCYPDNNYFSAVYRLNPGLDSLVFPADRKLVLPAFVPTRETDSLIKQGYLVAWKTDFSLKEECQATARMIRPLLGRIGGRGTGSNLPPDPLELRKEELMSEGAAYYNSIHLAISNDKTPWGRDFISQFNGEAKVLYANLLTKPVKKENLDTIEEVVKDLRLKSQAFTDIRGPGNSSGRYPEVTLKVTVLDHSGNRVDHLRVFFVAKVLVGDPEMATRSTGFSSPTIDTVGVANYYIYACPPASTERITELFPLDIDYKGPHQVIPVQISTLK